MLKHNLRVAYRNLIRHPGYAFMNILGLTVGLTTFILIALYIQYEFSFDKFHQHYDDIYQVHTKAHLSNGDQYWHSTPYPLGAALENEFSEIQESVTLRGAWGEYLSTGPGKTFYEENGWYTNASLFRVLTFTFLKGNPEKVLTEPNHIVLSASLAQKFFPDQDPMGKVINCRNKAKLMVTGVFEDLPENSSLKIDYLGHIQILEQIDQENLQNWGNSSFSTILLVDNAHYNDLKVKMGDFLNKQVDSYKSTLQLVPLSDLHLRSYTPSGGLMSIIYMYGAIAVFALLVACVNFTNLNTAFASLRSREIGIKKVVGSQRFSLIKQFLLESLVISLIAMVLAFIMAEIFLQLFNQIIGRSLKIDFINNYPFVFFILGITMLTSLLAGSYPAFYLSALKPLKVLKSGSLGSQRSGLLRKSLVTFQFVVSSLLVVATFMIFRQFNYLKNKDLGFNQENILYTKMHLESEQPSLDFNLIRNQLLQQEDIINAAVSYNLPFMGNWGSSITWEGSDPDQRVDIRRNVIGYDYLETMGLHIIKGRNFSREMPSDQEGACLINQTAAAFFGWEDPIGKTLDNGNLTVIGVVNDFHPYSVSQKIPPFLFTLHSDQVTGIAMFTVKIRPEADLQATRSSIRLAFKQFLPDEFFEFHLLADQLDREALKVYKGITSTFTFFAIITILISAVGLFGLTSFSARSKTKEIGIRKVHGARTGQVFYLLIREFLFLILLANLIAWPLAYKFQTIDPSAYKIGLNGLDFVAGAVFIITIAFLTVSYQSYKVAHQNPVESLRYE
ncbi:MAG: ABC transporter permease [Candidatus Cyclobacteriaceae bacterium M3_2C_046]